MTCSCFIVPKSVLDRFAADASLPADSREAFAATASLETVWRTLRSAHTEASQSRLAIAPIVTTLAAAPATPVFDCNSSTSLPGTALPSTSTDATGKRAGGEAAAVAQFYKDCFGRNSVDNAGKTLVSSIHYGAKYNNAFWNGSQMAYGDGDGNIFIDFTLSNDVIGHELTHGVTQYTLGLGYTNQAGALNEAISDVFGTMFRQWQGGQAVTAADWLIGSGIMGPAAKAKGYNCLRDMAHPDAGHCLSAQPADFAHYVPGGDPHVNSGIPNRAFYLMAMAIGGNSWEKTGKVWYAALTAGSSPKMSFKAFAKRTRAAAKQLFPADPTVLAGVNAGWKGVGVA